MLSLPVVQAGRGEPRLEGGSRQEGDERARRLRHGTARGEAGRVGGDLLQVFRQRTHQGDALDADDLADLVRDQLDLPLGDQLRRVAPGTSRVFALTASAMPSRSSTPANWIPPV